MKKLLPQPACSPRCSSHCPPLPMPSRARSRNRINVTCRDVPWPSWPRRWASPTGRPRAPRPPRTSTPAAAASPVSRTVSRLPAITCRRPRSSVFSGLVFSSGYDGLIYSIGFLVGWPIIMFVMAEQLRILGKFTFADVASYRFGWTSRNPHRSGGYRHAGRRRVLPDRADGRCRQADPDPPRSRPLLAAVVGVGVLMLIYVVFGGMTATTWVQIIKAVLLLAGATFMALAGAVALRLRRRNVRAGGRRSSKGDNRSWAGRSGHRSDRGDLAGSALMFGTAGLPHILMRFFTVAERQDGPSVGVLRDRLHRLLLHPDLHHRLRRDRAASSSTRVLKFDALVRRRRQGKLISGLNGGTNMVAIHLANAVGGNIFLGFISAVAFATILAVVSGLTLAGASAIRPTLYASVIAKGRSDEVTEMKVSRGATITPASSPSSSASSSRSRTSRSWSVWPSRSRPAPTSRADHVGVLVEDDDARRDDRRLDRPDRRGGADRHLQGHLGRCHRQCRTADHAEQPGDHLDPVGVHRDLAVLGHRQEQGAEQDLLGFEAQDVRCQTGIGAEGASGH